MAPCFTSNFPGPVLPCTEVPVLLIDDDHHFRVALAENLRTDGHEVSEFLSPHTLPSLESTLDRVAVIISEYQLPGEDGLSFTQRVHAIHPTLPVVMLTAYWSEHLEAEVTARPSLSLLWKPVAYESIHALVHDLVTGSPL